MWVRLLRIWEKKRNDEGAHSFVSAFHRLQPSRRKLTADQPFYGVISEVHLINSRLPRDWLLTRLLRP